jgi:hypothetical protein
MKENLKKNILEGKLTTMRWYGHVLTMKEQRILKKVFNIKVKGKRQRGRPRSR